ncbi:PspC domain-containing protein [Microbacterium esteraromaticum]|uniref:PspC domain-containing protein n=1 Tax=Microbacterium esteraromaticum TaxID=57043 RepID=A0A7D8AHL6_9MICO|nr:ATP-binding protein [Microbacterium esteraromaticum]QMU96225.1 PspC domain-containing protein [Microbacterium esteraromaticum]
MSTSVPLAIPTRSRASAPARPALARVRECLITGTAEGLARHLGTSPALVRTVFIVSAPMAGFGILLYIWCWMLTPWEQGDARPSRRMPVAWLLLVGGGVLSLIVLPQLGTGYRFGVWLGDLGDTTADVWIIADVLTLFMVVVPVVAAALWADLVDRDDPRRGPRHTAVVRVIAVVCVVILLLALLRASNPFLLLAPFAGLLAIFSSSLAHRWRELAGERVRRIREEQRSEMAAHLHDSVLQTLALIQNRAGASSEAARLARAQERELRAWLYDGDAPADSDLATDLRDYAGALELDYPARIDVVSAGLSTERASGELAAAAREAMLNAARHAGGEVSVYIEGAATGVDVFVRDRGAGFDLDDVPSDRLGVRQSIVGRMRRAGGTATVRSDANGTEVHLRIVGTAARAAEARPNEERSHG